MCLRMLFLFCLGLFAPGVMAAADYVAYSLREAQARLEAGRNTRDVSQLSGVTRLAGMVVDASAPDVILVGQREAGLPPLELDDLVVSMRALMLHKQWPLVSLDNSPQTSSSRRQKVRFEGAIANTRLGKALLEADLILKQLALGKRSAEIWGVKSYAALCDEAAQREEANMASVLFWFFPMDSRLVEREGVFALGGLSVGTKTQLLSPSSATNAPEKDASSEKFARDLTSAFAEVAMQFPELRRIEQLFSAVAIAHGLRETRNLPDLSFFLKSYQVVNTPTPEELPVMTAPGARMDLTGGVELRALLLRLRDGDVTALREAVLRSRPDGNALSWPLPLAGWQIAGSPTEAAAGQPPLADGKFGSLGVSINRQPSAGPERWPTFAASVPSRLQELPAIIRSPTFPRAISSPGVGGVMLSGTASVAGEDGQRAGASSFFSLLATGENASLSAEAFRRFVTALWAVYFSETDPGISIDPIAPGVKQHLVRYIGNVMNSDLGRVMREADYVMKQWAVGSARPDIMGFQNPDDIAGRRGVAYVGAGSRFWFVPRDLTFRRAGGALVFDHGQMTVQTEFLFNNSQGLKADPANEQWAAWFTEHYQEVAAKHPVFAELFDYAKLVALARHLKESGTPLLWFLLANKDLALTEDSPGTVEALVKNSDHFDGLRIEGGVQLVSPPQYILDKAARAGLAEARERERSTSTARAAQESPDRDPQIQPVFLQVAERSYSVVPQHALACGKDQRGHRYQTDFALRSENGPGLELVRWFSNAQDEEGDFGRGWHLLIPYRVEPDGEDRIDFLKVNLPARMRLRHLLSGRNEVLTFSTNRYSVAGWVPETLGSSEVLGLFPLSDATFRLEDKLGNRFSFNEDGHLTEMIFARSYRFNIEYATNTMDVLRPRTWQILGGTEQVPFANALVPRAVTLVDRSEGTRDTYVFSTQGDVVGYRPTDQAQRSRRFIALLSGGSFRFQDHKGNLLHFNPAGELTAAELNPGRPLIRSISQGKQQVRFQYALKPSGRAFISTASVERSGQSEYLRYVQGDEDRLSARPTLVLTKN